jgi:hypothetical protein
MGDQVPAFRLLPEDVLHLEIRTVVDQTLSIAFRELRDGDDLPAERLAGPLRDVMARVEDRLGLADVLNAYIIGSRSAWDRAASIAQPDDAELTGLDPFDPDCLRVLSAALTAHDLSESGE